MARLIYGTANATTGSSATGSTQVALQFNSDTAGRVMVFAAHARVENTGYVYIGTDSATSSAAGWELGGNEEVTWRYKDYLQAASIPPSDHWYAAQSTAAKIDWFMLLEN